jgi:septal ring factor EnvC (AmiA/AmiB activator)
MDLGQKLVKDVRNCVQYQEELKAEIASLNNQVALENQYLSMIEKDGKQLSAELASKQDIINSLKEQEEFLDLIRDNFINSLLWASYFKNFVVDMEPDNEQMEVMMKDMQHRYDSLIEHYEQKPEYRQIIEAESTTRELNQVLCEKRNELMKLETEREY